MSVSTSLLTDPIQLFKIVLGNKIIVVCKGDKTLEGVLHAYDVHLNLIMSPCKETTKVAYIDEKTANVEYNYEVREFGTLYVRGDGLILMSPVI